MLRKYHYIASTESGTQTEVQVEAHDESIANAEAMHEVKKWLDEEGEPVARLNRFDLVFREPA